MARKGQRSRMEGIALSWAGKEPLSREFDLASADDLRAIERIGSQPSGQLIAGDNLVAMHALAAQHAGKIDLIYIDPPFATGLDYVSLTRAGVERRAYRDRSDGGMVGYLEHMRERLVVMHTLLADDGKLFLHCDWRANSALRLLLDEIFGAECFRNEIVWRRAPNLGRQAASSQLGRVFDTIYVYSKTKGAKFGGEVPRRRALVELDGKGKPKGARWDEAEQCYFTTAPRGDYTDKSIARLREKNRVYDSASGKVYIKYYLTLGDDGRWYKEQPVDALWDDFAVRPLRHRPKSEDMGYDTQKPEGLLERIISWATKPGDLVADFYAGSGTTAAVAEALGRRWITSDIGQAALATTRRRLLERGASFDVLSVERAERRVWARANDDVRVVLEARGATPTEARWGKIGEAHVWVAPHDEPLDEVRIERLCEERHGDIELLSWEWSAQDSAAIKQRVRHNGVALTLRTIPMDLVRGTHAVTFPERPEVDVEVIGGAAGARVRLTHARCGEPPSHWSDLIDSWMVAWRPHDATRPSWHGFRAAGGALALETPPIAGASEVDVTVLTVFGDEFAKTLVVEC